MSLTRGPISILKEHMNGSLKISNCSFYAILCLSLRWKISYLELLSLTLATQGGPCLCVWGSEYLFLEGELSLCKHECFAQKLLLIFLRYR